MKIANASAFWGDDNLAALEIVENVPDIDFITFDYLAELTLSILAIQKEKDSNLGYAHDFIEVVKSLEGKTKAKLIANAGGLNPLGLKKALEKITKRKVVAISGDEVLDQLKQSPNDPLFQNLETRQSLSTILKDLKTANAYMGADPIVKALQEGAEIVVTGRVADPSLTLAPLIYKLGFKDWNALALGTLAGHLIECGCQVTGGLYSGWDNLKEKPGYPIIEISNDNSFIITSYRGFINSEVVKEQILYEMGDPEKYFSPDVTLSLKNLKIEEKGFNRVQVSGALGFAPTKTYKVSATYEAGFKAEGSLLFIGINGKARAKKVADRLIESIKPQKHEIDIINENNKTFLRIAAFDQNEATLKKFVRAFAPFVTAGPPGTTGYTGGRSPVRPVYGYWPCLIEKEKVCASLN